jgi:hypothetical protein
MKTKEIRRKAIETKGFSSIKQKVFGIFETFGLVGGVKEESEESTHEIQFPHVAHEQMTRSRAEAELRKAEAQAWYMRQKNRIM